MSRTTPPYEIHSVREIPFAAARRTEVAVIVPVGTTVEDTAAIGREIAKDRRGVADYNVLQVAFYDRVELIGPTGGPAPLGFWVYAPHGDWGRSLEAVRGRYDNFEENTSRLRAVDWSRRPSEREVRLNRAWFDELDAIRSERGAPDALAGEITEHENEATRRVMVAFGVPETEVNAAFMAVTLWTLG